MNHLENKEIDIRHIEENSLIKNKDILTKLLEENLMINFPELKNLNGFAVNSYENMVKFKKDNSAILLGAFKENIIVGFLWAYRKRLLGEERIHIDHVVVNSTLRSSGVGTRLLTTLEDMARDEGIFKIELVTTADNENTMKFYNAKGFSTVRVQLEKELGAVDANR